MLDRQLLDDLRLIHASFNTVMMLLFFYQGFLGFRIRRERKGGNRLPVKMAKRHRTIGSMLAPLGVLGFFAGLSLAILDYGSVLKHTSHFLVGLLLALLITTTFFISKKIRGPESAVRSLHYRIGICILCLYPVQAFLGLGILL
jgi:hypothetical protein